MPSGPEDDQSRTSERLRSGVADARNVPLETSHTLLAEGRTLLCKVTPVILHGVVSPDPSLSGTGATTEIERQRARERESCMQRDCEV